MKHVLLVLALLMPLVACSEEPAHERQPGRTVIATNPMAQVKAKLEKDPRDADAWFHLADLYERSGMYPQEVDALEKLIAVAPERGYTYIKLGNTFNRLGKHAEAVEQFRKGTKYLPTNPVLYNNMAFAYGKMGKTTEQIRALKKAIKLRAQYATARYNLGIVYVHQGKKKDAMVQYRKLMDIDKTMAEQLKKEIDTPRK